MDWRVPPTAPLMRTQPDQMAGSAPARPQRQAGASQAKARPVAAAQKRGGGNMFLTGAFVVAAAVVGALLAGLAMNAL